MLRNGVRLVMGLSHWYSPLHRCPAFNRLSLAIYQLAPIHTRNMTAMSSTVLRPDVCKDFALPNSSWKKELMDLYNKFIELTTTGTWKRLPSRNASVFNLTETELNSQRRTRLFTRNLDEEGTGLEYVMFLNLENKQVVGLFQAGPYLEGPPGLTHGGCIATIIDVVTGTSAIHAAGKVLTANLNINYRNPVPLESVFIVESHVDRTEGKKVFLSCRVRNADDTILYAEATALFIMLKFNEREP